MSRLSQTPSVTTTAEVELSPKLTLQLKASLEKFAALRAEKKATIVKEDALKLEVESLFEAAGEYRALCEGVKVDTAFGPVSLKEVIGGTKKTFQKKLLMTRHKLTVAQVDALYTETPKADYLSVSLPRDPDDKDDDDSK